MGRASNGVSQYGSSSRRARAGELPALRANRQREVAAGCHDAGDGSARVQVHRSRAVTFGPEFIPENGGVPGSAYGSRKMERGASIVGPKPSKEVSPLKPGTSMA